MTLSAHYQMFARYNAWANARLFGAAAQLGSEQYRADRGAFFKSVHTLNHLLATDRIGAAFHRHGHCADEAGCDPVPKRSTNFARARAEDRRIVDFVDSLDDARLAGSIEYRRVSTPECSGSH
jgi:uncharacterized damage-inducible protein DinB